MPLTTPWTYMGAPANGGVSPTDTGMGVNALAGLTTSGITPGVGNSAFGYNAGAQIQTAIYNTVIGSAAGYSLRFAGEDGNVFVGASAGVISRGAGSVAIGTNAGASATPINTSVIIGNNVGYAAFSITREVAIGESALYSARGADNTSVGYLSGVSITTGVGNTFIGSGAGNGTPATANYSIGIGYGAAPQSSNVCVIGGAAGTGTASHVGIGTGTTVPAAALDVHDNVPLLITGTNIGAQSASGGGFMATYADPGALITSGSRLGGHLIGGSLDGAHTLFQATGITSYATENWTATTAHGADLRFETTVNGGSTRTERMRFNGSGQLIVGATSTPGGGPLTVAGSSPFTGIDFYTFSAVTAGVSFAGFNAFGYDNTTTFAGATINIRASENWSSTNHGSYLQFRATPAGAGGALTEVLRLTGEGNIYGKAGTTTMTDGFFYTPAAAGAPTGVPTAVAGSVPMYYDTTNNRFYVYNGAWKSVLLA